MNILREYEDVFSTSPESLPKPMKEVPPHVFKMKEGAKPVYCRRPYWGPQTRAYLKQWTEWALDEGLLEPAPESSWASRIVIAPKYKGGTAKSQTPDGLRICVDFTAVNAWVEKMVPTYPDPHAQLKRAAGYDWYFSGDGLKQFWSIVLAEKCRDMTAIWTPLGLMRFTRLIMGTSNASTVAQNHYTRAINRFITGTLPGGEAIADRVFNFQDDFLLAGSLQEIKIILKAFLHMCRQAGIQMNPAKTHLTNGKTGAQFYGFKVTKKGVHPAEKNLDPIKKMTAPKDVSGVRAILGVFNQFRSFIKRYDRITKPIQDLVKKHARFKWTDEAQKALNELKAIMLKGDLYLKVQDPTVPLELETDGSDDGWGAILYQMIKGERRVICMWSKQWSASMRRMPAYYRETKAWMLGVEKARIYADYNHHPLVCWTDHIPLTYLKHTSGKGPVSQFHLDHLSSIDYVIKYRKGTEIGADHVSRFPLLGPRHMGPGGRKKAVEILILNLPAEFRPQGKIWVYAGKETGEAKGAIRAWRLNKQDKHLLPHDGRPTPKNIMSKEYTFAIWIPHAENIVNVLQKAYEKNEPFACLIPSGLVHVLQLSQEAKTKLALSAKIALLQPELTWIIHRVEGMAHRVMAAWSVQSFISQMPETNESKNHVGPAGWKDEEFLAEQKEAAKAYKQECVVTRKDGFAIYKPDAQTQLVILPPGRAKELTMWQHERMCHAGQAKVATELAKHFHWPNLRTDVRRWVTQCPSCQLLKAKRRKAHNHFRAKPEHKPRTAYAMDFYGVGQSKNGYKNILGIIDLATSELALFPTKDRKAKTVRECLLAGIFLSKGCPSTLHSDHAREFISKAVKRICSILGCRQTTTLAHHPTGNATIERVWQYITLVLRNCNNEQYKHWDGFVKLWEHTWNTNPHTLLEVSPFEAAHGMPAVSATETLANTPVMRITGMQKDDLIAIQKAAKANIIAMKQLRTHDKAMRAIKANQTKISQTFKVGDKVSFYIPPTGSEAARRSTRKTKHLLQYKGPAVITNVRTPTTYDLTYKGRQYARATSELRPYRAERETNIVQTNAEEEARNLQIGSWVAYLEESGDKQFHIGKVKSLGDNIVLQAFATHNKNLQKAKWKPLLQLVKTEQYTLYPDKRTVQVQVLDEIPTSSQKELIIATNLKLVKQKLDKKSRVTLQLQFKTHHQLGKTFP